MELELTKTNLTPEIVKSDLSIELSRVGLTITKLSEMERELVFNEDEIQHVTDFINKIKSAEKTIEIKRTELKKPVLDRGNTIDAGAKLITTELAAIKKRVSEKYTKLAIEMAQRQKEAADKLRRETELKKLVDDTFMNFAERISGAKTHDEVLDIERRLNLETANQSKYGEFLEDLVTRCKGIRTLIADRKNSVRLLSELDKKENHATETGQDDKLEQILEQKQEIEDKLSENSIKIQETASQQAKTTTTKVEQQFASVAPKRTTKEAIIENKDLAFKKMPELFFVIENKDAIKALGKKLRDEGIWKEGEEYIYFGIKFFEKKTYA